jgi:hypothetical protein
MYHVYAEDGYESAHRSLRAAERAARRGAKRRGLEYRVVECDPRWGYSGGGRGQTVYRVRGVRGGVR